jgi:hypothetical protein
MRNEPTTNAIMIDPVTTILHNLDELARLVTVVALGAAQLPIPSGETTLVDSVSGAPDSTILGTTNSSKDW